MSNKWRVVQKKAIDDNGELLWPERLSREFLEQAKRTMGSYMFANQYQNEIIPLDAQTFKPHWLRYYEHLPDLIYNFAYIDPAISQADSADFTAWVIISVDTQKNWYVREASHARINPSELINLVFKIWEQWKPQAIGIEDVAFQRALVHFAYEEMQRRGIQIPSNPP